MIRPKSDPGEPFARIDVNQAKAMMDGGNAQIVDVREPKEYAGGHIPGALLIPVDQVLKRGSELRKDGPIIFVCQVGARSALAAEMAAALGHQEIYNLEGGTEAWIKQGYPVEK